MSQDRLKDLTLEQLTSLRAKITKEIDSRSINAKCICAGFFRPINCPIHGLENKKGKQ